MRRIVLVAFALLAPVALEAKGPTMKLTLTGHGLATPIEIVEPGILSRSGVWDGSFIGETLAAVPPVKEPIYTVSFDVKLPEWQRAGVKTMYTVLLARDPQGSLFLYLPGRGDAGYRLNASTILRDTQDGHWHRPSPAWAAAIAKYVP